MTAKRPRCPYCGRRHTGQRADGEPCLWCERIGRIADARPRAWDRTFDDRLAWLFVCHPCEWLHVSKELGCDSEDAKWGVRLLRRRGFVIEGDARRGYRLTGWTRWSEE